MSNDTSLVLVTKVFVFQRYYINQVIEIGCQNVGTAALGTYLGGLHNLGICFKLLHTKKT